MTLDERIEAARKLKGYTPGPWYIERRHIRADRSDVEYERRRKLKKGEARRDLKIGDSLVSTVQSVGPVSPDHNHWTGHHLSIDDADAALIAAAPGLHRLALDLAAENDRLLADVERLRVAGRALWFELINFACPGDGTCNCRTCSTIRAWNYARPDQGGPDADA